MAGDLVTIKTFEFLPEAEVARLHLEAERIPAYLADAETIYMAWSIGNAIGYIKLQVPQADSNRAMVVLEQPSTTSGETHDTSDDPETALCLACGARIRGGDPCCPSCGWSYATEEGENDQEDSADDRSGTQSEQAETPSAFDRLRALKRPVFWLFLAPVIIAFSLLAVVLLVALARLFVLVLSAAVLA